MFILSSYCIPIGGGGRGGGRERTGNAYYCKTVFMFRCSALYACWRKMEGEGIRIAFLLSSLCIPMKTRKRKGEEISFSLHFYFKTRSKGNERRTEFIHIAYDVAT